jgi:hypothetical protein
VQDYPDAHDCEINSYEVYIEGKTLILHTKYSGFNERKNIDISFSGVLTHYFEDVSHQNVISEIYEPGIEEFIEEYRDTLNSKKNYCWPMNYEAEDDLYNKLTNNSYKVFYIDSSTGLHGFVIAKQIDIQNVMA